MPQSVSCARSARAIVRYSSERHLAVKLHTTPRSGAPGAASRRKCRGLISFGGFALLSGTPKRAVARVGPAHNASGPAVAIRSGRQADQLHRVADCEGHHHRCLGYVLEFRDGRLACQCVARGPTALTCATTACTASGIDAPGPAIFASKRRTSNTPSRPCRGGDRRARSRRPPATPLARRARRSAFMCARRHPRFAARWRRVPPAPRPASLPGKSIRFVSVSALVVCAT